MPTSCVFELDRLNPVYNSGEYISGRILLRTHKVKRVNAVYVTLEGEAKVQWSMSGKSETANYSGHQQYLYTRTNVFDNTVYRAGMHVYMLTVRIPPNCPSSCKGPYGYIAYNITLTIDKPWGFDEIFRKPITVVQFLDLNFNPEFALPVKDENTKYLCHWPCISGPIISTLTLPAAGFVPLQDIPFTLEIDNQSPHYDVVSIEVSLKQHFVFVSRKPLKRNFYSKALVKEIITERALRLTKRIYNSTINVPMDTPRSTLNPSYIVFLHYTLHLKLKTGYFHYDTELSVPIIIGTKALHQFDHILHTSQPQLRVNQATERQRLIERVVPRPVEPIEETPESDTLEVHQMLDEDEPPSYDSCLPPSFSYATLGSQQTLEGQTTPCKSTVQRINLPHFPGFNTFIDQMPANTEDSALDLRLYRSYGSLNTDQTGRSLDTFGSMIGIISEMGGQLCNSEQGPNSIESEIQAEAQL